MMPLNTPLNQVYYCVDTGSYRTSEQDEEINILKNIINCKKKEREKKLDNIISYFYSLKPLKK